VTLIVHGPTVSTAEIKSVRIDGQDMLVTLENGNMAMISKAELSRLVCEYALEKINEKAP